MLETIELKFVINPWMSYHAMSRLMETSQLNLKYALKGDIILTTNIVKFIQWISLILVK